jgi:hypothetical protein
MQENHIEFINYMEIEGVARESQEIGKFDPWKHHTPVIQTLQAG